jgi:small-conductance mechanosensitive channel/CRP-like cAMP-binding protein
LEHIQKTLSGISGATIGVSVALVLLGAAALLFDASERRALKQPLYFLIAHLVFKGFALVLEEPSAMWRVATLLSLATLLIAIGRAGVLLFVEAILGKRLGQPLPKIIRDILQGVVYFVLLLGVLRELGLEPGQLLTTSALLTAVIGLSLQDTLGNLIAGLAVQMQRPFDVGDWIQYDAEPKNIGRVIEINWRATRIITLDEIEIVVPNGLLAKSPLKNYTRPTRTSRRNLYFSVGFDVPPRKVHEIVRQAIADTPGVLREPPPSIVTNGFGDAGIEYWVRVFTDQFHRRDIVDGNVRDRIWYGLQRAGISIPFPHRAVHMQQHSEETQAKDDERRTKKLHRALSHVDFLEVVDDKMRQELAGRASTRLFSAGEMIVRQGEETDDFFIILKGEVAVVLESASESVEVTRLGRGKFFGEMALVTGEKRKASVKATTDCELLVIDHDAFEHVLRQKPEVVEALSRVLAERQLQLDEHAARASSEDRTSMVERESSQLLGRIKRFFSLK